MHTDNIRPIRKGKINLSTGDFNPDDFVCQETGSLTITWVDNTTTVLNMAQGDTAGFSSHDCKTVSITTGKFMKV